ncbi:FadR/GntR family transcriptional regulator [uncultured Dysosmobacter sp.]|uniref:FadR/GntR family transcriptional regulator n=1 Tax=uncultured Dysosmobacter sp. TaxID=2591384 RepID=UPI002633BDD9|nr:FadR/GntR family transcriptional regulator [uncultured Dysosmobacter sp.]
MKPEYAPIFSPAATMRAPEVIYNQIYEKILRGELKPGDRLPPERVLAEQFCRSRPSVREALRMLQENGYIRIEGGRSGGSIVKGISIESLELPLQKVIRSGVMSLQELVDYRCVNDLGCARLAAQYHTEQDAAILRSVMEDYRGAIADFERFKKVDTEFHSALACATHNSLIIAINDVLISPVEDAFWMAAEKMEKDEIIEINRTAYSLHNQVAEAVLAKDPAAAEKYMRDINGVYARSVFPYSSTSVVFQDGPGIRDPNPQD